ncbi:MAG: Hsp33 family molecular chaperone [Rhizobiaceae bacterium]
MTAKQLGDLGYTGDDQVVPFSVEALDVRGRSVQLGPMLDRIIRRHAYPDAVSQLLAEAVVLTALLGSSLKFDGRFIVQTQTDGPVNLMVVDFATPGRMRAYARFDEDKLVETQAAGSSSTAVLLGQGVLALTIDQGRHTQRYQGVVPLDGTSLEEAARTYFRQSEQIPSEIRLGVARLVRSHDDGAPEEWRAGGMIAQFLPDAPERMPRADLPSGNDVFDKLAGAERDDSWEELVALMGTIETSELVDPTVGSERLLYRLFHQHGVRVFESAAVEDRCNCSREKIAGIISGFTDEEIETCIEDGRILVNCEFCSTGYDFDPSEFR